MIKKCLQHLDFLKIKSPIQWFIFTDLGNIFYGRQKHCNDRQPLEGRIIRLEELPLKALDCEEKYLTSSATLPNTMSMLGSFVTTLISAEIYVISFDLVNGVKLMQRFCGHN